MHLDTFRLLLTPEGQNALHAARELAPKEADFLTHYQSLSCLFSADLARLALEIAILRKEAQVKFPFADKLYLTRPALEQASSQVISTHRAQRYQQFARLADLGCSVGSDTLALAKLAPTMGADNDLLRLAMAQANVHALELDERASFIQTDLTKSLPLSPSSNLGLFFDPARRSGSRRSFSVRHYLPPLSIIEHWLPSFPALGVKLSPGVNLDELSGYDAEIEFISLQGELKEAVLWFGPFKTCLRRASLLPGGHTLVGEAEDTRTLSDTLLSQPLCYLYEPDAAILRAGLVRKLAQQINARQLDPDIAYLTADACTPTPFARAWQVEDWFSFQLKHLRSYLHAHNVGRVTVKKRGSPWQPEALIKQLRLHGEDEKVLVLTHLDGRAIVIIASPHAITC